MTVVAMQQIFISYKREERARARELADAFQATGLTVWWDPDLQAGERFDDVIEQAITECACVVVIWSKASVVSSYVKDEASLALNLKKLVPVALDDTTPPFRFHTLHTHSLHAWNGKQDGQELQPILRDIRKYIANPIVGFDQRNPEFDTLAEESSKAKNRSTQENRPVSYVRGTRSSADVFVEPVFGFVIGTSSKQDLQTITHIDKAIVAAILDEDSKSPIHASLDDDETFHYYFVNPTNTMDVGLRVELNTLSLNQLNKTLVANGYQVRPNEVKRARRWFEVWDSSRYTVIKAAKVLGLSGTVIFNATYRASNLEELENSSSLLYYSVSFYAGEASPYMLEFLLR